MELEPVIGLEIHAQMATESKIFCRCSTEFGRAPNDNTCPVCLGLPGVLPVLNGKVVENAIKLGLATHCKIRMDSQFARKNYFYPDLPKAYQISQYDRPICEKGWVDIEVEGVSKRIGITRIHMEEDAGKLVHEEQGEHSFVDLNRAGIPLLEIVSEPDLRTSAEAKAYMEKIHSLVSYLGVCNGNMEKGELRCDANVSLRPQGQAAFGTRTETKNLNSFRFVQQAINYEIERQTEVLFEGETIVQETRLWDSQRKITYSMRSKEDAHDYRYFPDPDLPVVQITQAQIENLRQTLPELPEAKAQRFQEHYGLKERDVAALVVNREVADYFEEVISLGGEPKLVCNWLNSEFARVMNETQKGLKDLNITPEKLQELLGLVQSKSVSSSMAKKVFEEMLRTGKSPKAIVEDKSLSQMSDEVALSQMVADLMAANPDQVAQYRSGKTKIISFFIGQLMKATKGKANPEIINRLLEEKLNG
ncbi:Asp-tRNA(Asn)/Glu-tRNA(Gln) amidotransferase subunit GatB [Deltaproteobacteria bacterium TL4]